MLYEKKKILAHRLIWLGLLILGIIIPIILLNLPLEIIDHNGYMNEYSNGISDIEIEIVFNRKISSGDIWIAFYDSNGNLLSSEWDYFYDYDNTFLLSFDIYGKADSYEILYYDVTPTSSSVASSIFYIDLYIIVPFFIASLFLAWKQYDYNGNSIVVYAGWFHHYIKVNGEKFDEHNTLISYTAILLSCVLDDGTDVKATITRSNRISLKINNQLYTQRN